MAALRTILLLLSVVVSFACGTRKRPDEAEPSEPADAPAEAPADTSLLDQATDDARLREEFEDVMYRRHLTAAKRFRQAGQLEPALNEIQSALQYQPTAREAEVLRGEILRELGQRAGEADTLVRDQWEAYRVRLEEQKITVRRNVDAGDEALAARQFPAARRAYENAIFIVETSRLGPIGGDFELRDLGERARRGLEEIDELDAAARAEREQGDIEAALARVAEEEEREILAARDRRARLLSTAIDRFNEEEFDDAAIFARQVLDEEPDNTVARDILENSRRAGHSRVNVRYLLELKESFRKWQVDIEAAKMPQSKILAWPSQSFWDKITRLRASTRGSTSGRPRTEEEKAVLQTMEARTIDLPFDETPFPQAVNYLTAASGLNFVVDARAKDDLDAAVVTLQAGEITVKDALEIIMTQVSSEGEVVYEVVGNVVRFIRKEHRQRINVLRVHPVADLTLGLTDFIPPQITQVGVDEDSETPLFGGQAEEAPQPYGTIEELMELVRGSVSPQTWEEDGQLNAQGKNLVVYAPPGVHDRIAAFLDDLRAFAGIIVTVESRFLSMSNAFLSDVGVDLRGLGGTNSGPLAQLDDVTSGLDDNASAGFDNSGPGVNAGAAALAPSSGLFFNDGSDGDFRSRSENIFTNPLGQMLTALGGGTFQVTYLDDVAVSAVIRATEKSAEIREMQAPSVTVYNTQRANITVVNQVSFVQDFDVEVAQTSFIADPVIGVIQEGLVLDVRPTVSNDRQFITLELRPTLIDLTTPITTFQTLLGAAIATGAAQNPVVIQLPQIDIRSAESTVRIPDGGSIVLGGLKEINIEDKKASTPVLGQIPVLNFLFGRQGKSEEIEHLMIIVTATITDVGDEAERRLQ